MFALRIGAFAGLVCLCSLLAQAATVKVVHLSNGYQLQVDGKPFFVKGGGGDYSREVLRDAGGNSFRTWGDDDLKNQLAIAHRDNLMVAAGFWLGHEEQGFHYSDEAAVQRQISTVLAGVLKYKDDPNVLLWSIGNEMEGYQDGSDPKMWAAVEDIARAIKQIDHKHPVMTVIAEVGGHKVQSLHKYCPDIDIVGINSYGGATSLGERYKAAGGAKPWILTEFGPPGTWESAKNSWGVPTELTSTEKAKRYTEAYRKAVLANPDLCLGSYAFAWGNKQEATATWFGLFLPDGSRLQAVDELSALWNGQEPTTECPLITSLSMESGPQISVGSTAKAKLEVMPGKAGTYTTEWILQRDNEGFGVNGDIEAAPPSFPNLIKGQSNTSATIQAPKRPGHYRLFAYVRDGQGRAATANIPLLVKGTDNPNLGTPAGLPLLIFSSGKHSASYIPSGWMGDASALKYDANNKDFPRQGRTHSLLITFNKAAGWGGIAWQLPEGDWGDKPGGLDLTGAHKVSFWLRSDGAGFRAKFGMGLIKSDKPYPDTGFVEKEVDVTGRWQKCEIDLSGLDLSRIKTGFYVTFAGSGEPMRLYMDDISIE